MTAINCGGSLPSGESGKGRDYPVARRTDALSDEGQHLKKIVGYSCKRVAYGLWIRWSYDLVAGYATEVSPDALLRHDVKQTMGKAQSHDREDAKFIGPSCGHCGQKQSEVIRSIFKVMHVQYAA